MEQGTEREGEKEKGMGMSEVKGWRTVEVHGKPTKSNLPAFFINTFAPGLYGVAKSSEHLELPNTQWIPVVELLTLPDAPPPPRKVTIELDEDTARRIVDAYSACSWVTGSAINKTAAACRDALAKMDKGASDY